MSEMSREEMARKIEEHIAILADYDVIKFDVAETLTEHIWKILTDVTPSQIDYVTDIWDYLKNDEIQDK
jgi:hypothetical protein